MLLRRIVRDLAGNYKGNQRILRDLKRKRGRQKQGWQKNNLHHHLHEATPTHDFLDDGSKEPVKSASVGEPTPVRNRTLRFFSPDEPWDSDCSSEHSLDEIDEGDNQLFSGLGAKEYTRMLARATAV